MKNKNHKTAAIFIIAAVILLLIQTTTPTTPREPPAQGVRANFNMIAEMPYQPRNDGTYNTPEQFYQQGSGNCLEKSLAFADYIYNYGGRDIYIQTLINQDGGDNHAVVLWHNRVYDTGRPLNMFPSFYNISMDEYLKYQGNTFKVGPKTLYKP